MIHALFPRRRMVSAADTLRLLFRKDKEPFLRLEAIMGFLPQCLDFYRTALLHKSCGAKDELSHHQVNNERLEFLGDAVLGCAVADILYHRYPNKQEGYLTTLRSKIVKRETLNGIAVKLGLDQLVRHIGQATTGHNSYMNGNAFEAFVGAIYLDRGYDYCIKFLQEKVLDHCINIETVSQTEENYKSRLIEWCQKYGLQVRFELISQEMKNHGSIPTFVSRVCIEDIFCGRGNGYSKKESHQNAARQAYQRVTHRQAFVSSLMEARNRRTRETVADTKISKMATDTNTHQ